MPDLATILASGDVAVMNASDAMVIAGEPVATEPGTEALLASGNAVIDAANIKEGGSDVITQANIESAARVLNENGLEVPELADASAAANGSMFWNLDAGRLQYKSVGGIVLQFRMTLA